MNVAYTLIHLVHLNMYVSVCILYCTARDDQNINCLIDESVFLKTIYIYIYICIYIYIYIYILIFGIYIRCQKMKVKVCVRPSGWESNLRPLDYSGADLEVSRIN